MMSRAFVLGAVPLVVADWRRRGDVAIGPISDIARTATNASPTCPARDIADSLRPPTVL